MCSTSPMVLGWGDSRLPKMVRHYLPHAPVPEMERSGLCHRCPQPLLHRPFHAPSYAQSNRESVVHRPLEWSVCCAYAEIYEMAYQDHSLASFELIDTEQWIQDAVLRGATLVNPDYDPLIDDYSLIHASSRPKQALGSKSKQRLARIFVLVITGWGRVLDRIASECGIAIPEFPLNYAAILAGIQVPSKNYSPRWNRSSNAKLQNAFWTSSCEREKYFAIYRSSKPLFDVSARKRPELKPAPEMVARAQRHIAQSTSLPIESHPPQQQLNLRFQIVLATSQPIPKPTPIPIPASPAAAPVPIESIPSPALPEEPMQFLLRSTRAMRPMRL